VRGQHSHVERGWWSKNSIIPYGNEESVRARTKLGCSLQAVLLALVASLLLLGCCFPAATRNAKILECVAERSRLGLPRMMGGDRSYTMESSPLGQGPK
jgi:hypothetical protein